MAWRVSADPAQPQEAIDWFRARVPVPQSLWDVLGERIRRKAFTVAGVTALNLIKEVWESLAQALEEGTPYGEWAELMRKRLRAGWVRSDPWRLETIFRTNIQMAYSSGRWAQMTRPEVKAARPYWLYDAILDDRTTPICRDRHGVVRPADDPWWLNNTPPLHFNCRSGIRPITPEEARARGITDRLPITPVQEGFGHAPEAWEWSPNPADYPAELWEALTRWLNSRLNGREPGA